MNGLRFGRFTILILVVVTCVGLTCSAADTEESLCAEMWGSQSGNSQADAVQLDLTDAGYHIDVMGSMVFGKLTLEFSNPSETDLAALFLVGNGAGLGVLKTHLEVEGGTEDETTQEKADSAPKGSERSRPPATGRKGSPVQRIAVEAGQRVLATTSFAFGIPLKGGRYTLKLPPLSSPLGPPETTRALCKGDVDIPVSLVVNIHNDEPLDFVESSTHQVFVSFNGEKSQVELAGKLVQEHFALEFALGQKYEPDLLSYVGPETDGAREVLLVLTPPVQTPKESSVRAKEVLFVLDTSGSMGNGKLDEARMALNGILGTLSPSTRYNIAEFDVRFSMMQPEPVLVSELPIHQAGTWLAKQRPAGGTMLAPALKETLRQPLGTERHRMVIIITDGNISNEKEVLALLEAELGEARLFVVGIGEDVREETIRAMAEYGRGTATFVRDPAHLASILAEMFDTVSSPLAWDLKLEWGEAVIEKIEPSRVPDLYAGRPVTIRARISGELPGDVQINAETMEGSQTFHALLSATTEMPQLVSGTSPDR